jgi:hypothetical protein
LVLTPIAVMRQLQLKPPRNWLPRPPEAGWLSP